MSYGAAAGGAAVGTGLSLIQAFGQRSAAESQMDALAVAQQRSEQSAASKTALDLMVRKAETKKTIGTLRALGLGVQTNALVTQATADGAVDARTIKENYGQYITSSRAGLDAQFNQIKSSAPNPLFSALAGGIQGASLGLSLYTGINSALNISDETDLLKMREAAAREGGLPLI